MFTELFSTLMLASLAFASSSAGTISCQSQYNGGSNLLALVDESTGQTVAMPAFNSSFTINNGLADEGSSLRVPPADSVPILSAGPIGLSGYPWPGNDFVVYACNSTTMGYPAITTGANGLPVQYGQLVFVNDTEGVFSYTCVTQITMEDGSQFWANDPCETDDEISLLSQWFEFSTVSDEFEGYLLNVTFLGQTASGEGGKIGPLYFTPSTAENPTIGANTEPSGYTLQLEYIHVN